MTDYGHAMAIVRSMRRRAAQSRADGISAVADGLEQRADEREQALKTARWRCMHCGAIETHRGDLGRAPCGHFWWGDYLIVES